MIPDLSTVEARREVWALDLESGPPQTRGTLHRLIPSAIEDDEDPDLEPAGWCCWGRAAELMLAAGQARSFQVDDDATCQAYYFDGHDRMEFSTPPPVLFDWFGLDLDDTQELIEMNDTQQLPFDVIAKEIRRYNDPKETP